MRDVSDFAATSYVPTREMLSLDLFGSASVVPRHNPQAGNNESLNLMGLSLRFEHLDLVTRFFDWKDIVTGFCDTIMAPLRMSQEVARFLTRHPDALDAAHTIMNIVPEMLADKRIKNSAQIELVSDVEEPSIKIVAAEFLLEGISHEQALQIWDEIGEAAYQSLSPNVANKIAILFDTV